METHRVRAKVGIHEFDAEGDRETVDRQYAEFLKRIDGVGSTPTPAAPAAKIETPPANGGTNAIDDTIMARIFNRSGDSVSLNILPRTPQMQADALLVLLYGFERLLSRQFVGSFPLIAAARQSGIQLDRLDRVIDFHEQFIISGGFGRGRRYALNNQGKTFAETVIKGML
ncbi:MAG TPA: hypothetical protein VJZ71_19265 [Phycisphaerae bacterium]|nr:hypothetical protein [Phycisphaerae bacterium]